MAILSITSSQQRRLCEMESIVFIYAGPDSALSP